jgi:lipid A 3-O-deacylase
MHRLAMRLAAGVLSIVVGSATATAGTTTYDISSIIFEEHPFAASGPLRPVVAIPVPPDQIRAPARMPQPGPPSRSVPRSAAEPSAADRIPPATAQSLAAVAPAAGRDGLMGILSEIRVGVLAHDQGPFSSNEEGGIDGNFELLFVSPSFLDVIWAPRPHIGFSVNSDGDTSQVYAGLSWEWSFWGHWFAGFSLGGSVHDGETETDRVDRKELGCHLLFRESVEVGYRFGGRHAVSAFLDHISNANICDKNEGIDTFGLRYGYAF